jgi:hypothetical protein
MDANKYTTLTEDEKMALRKQRFNAGDSKINTVDSLKVSQCVMNQLLDEENQKIAERLKRFGGTNEDIEEQAIQKRLERFGPNDDEVIILYN